MIRFLILLEVVLLALLGVRWLEMAPASRNVDALPSGAAASAVAQVTPSWASAPMPDPDRMRLAHDLLGVTDALSPVSSDEAEPDEAEPNGQSRAKDLVTASGQAMSPAELAEVQRLLLRLGYSTGPTDGVWGPRTERAIDAWRQRSGRVEASGAESLVSQLRDDLRARSAAVAVRQAAMAPMPPRQATARALHAQSTAQPEWISSLAGGFQRLTGHDFDSRRNPQKIRDYCTANRETWIFDEGSHNFLWCGHSPQS